MLSNTTCTTVDVTWTNGNNDNRMLVVKDGSAVGGTPTNGTTYTANAAFGSGNTIATGEYVVYSGTGSSVTVTGLTSGHIYHFVVFEFNCSGASTAYLSTGSPATSGSTIASPIVTSDPSNDTKCEGNNQDFSVTATGQSISYQWQEDQGSGFADLSNTGVYSNVGTATMSITGVTAGMDGYSYRCVVSGTCSPNDTSASATLTVYTAPMVTADPSNATICGGDNQSFSVTATGGGLTYKWQEDQGSGFADLSNTGVYSNVTTATMSISGANSLMSGYQYQCIVSGPCGSDAVSNPAILTVNGILTPINRSSTVLNANSATVRWNGANSCHDTVIVWYKRLSDVKWKFSTITYEDSINLTGLISASDYEWTVRTKYHGILSAVSTNGNFTTTCNTTFPPINRSHTVLGSTSATVRWNGVNSCHDSVIVWYKRWTDAVWKYASVTYQDSINLTGLVAASNYEWKVRTKYNGILSSVSAADSFTTNCTIALAPINLNDTVLSATSATVRWNGANSCHDTVIVWYKRWTDAVWKYASVTYQDSINLTGLVSASYEWKVRTKYNGILSSLSVTDSFTTAASKTNNNTALSKNKEVNGKLLLYPNPTDNKITIEGMENMISLEVISPIGQIISRIPNTEKSPLMEIDLSNQMSGLYLLRMKDKEGSFILKKVVKQ